MQAGARRKSEAYQLGLPLSTGLLIAVLEIRLDGGLWDTQPVGCISERWRIMGCQTRTSHASAGVSKSKFLSEA